MTVFFCPLPLPTVCPHPRRAANTEQLHPLAAVGNVRLLRRAHEADTSRFVMSGRLADVCQALERLASEEMRRASH